MSPLVFTKPKFRHEEEKESSRQGCRVCAVGTEVRGRLLNLWPIKKIPLVWKGIPGRLKVSPSPCSKLKKRDEDTVDPLVINECVGKRSGPGQPIVAGPKGAAAR